MKSKNVRLVLFCVFALSGLFLSGPALAEESSSAVAPVAGSSVDPVLSVHASQTAGVNAGESNTQAVQVPKNEAVAPAVESQNAGSQVPSTGKGSDSMSGIQTKITGSETIEAQRLAGFGYDTFRSDGALISDGPVDESYLISPGDEIVVSIWGQLVETLNLTVTDEGFIELPDQGGRIQTNGVSLRDLKPRILQALSLIYAAYIDAVEPSKSKAFVDIRLGKLRKLSIFVVGEVNNPGAFNVSPGVANVINLLHNAGGVRDSGSLRNIKVRRNSGKIDVVDLYGFFLSGDIDFSTIRLGPGDYIIVPLKEKSVTIEGEVKRPNTYELTGGEGVRDLVKFAGGFTPDAYLKHVQIHRFEVNRGEVLVDLDLDLLSTQPEANPPLMNGDSLSIPKNIQVRKNSVKIQGDGITRAGTYEWTPGMTLNDLIEKGEGLREYAFLGRADLIRTESDFSRKLSVLSLDEIYKRDGEGKLVFTGNMEKNIPLREMDEVIIQSTPGMSGTDQFVTLEGKVKEPGRFNLAKDMHLYDLIFARGGFQDDALRKSTFMDAAHIFRKVPGTLSTKIISFNLGALLNGDPSADVSLEDNDVIRIYSYEEFAKKAEVRIDGVVKNPGAFPMVEDLTLEDLLVMAGGLPSDIEATQAIIARANAEGESRSIVVPIAPDYISMPKDRKTRLELGDKISVVGLSAKDRFVSIEGHVQSPGKFVLTKDMTLLDLISTRGGFQDATFRQSVFPDKAHIIRTVPGMIGKKIIPFNLGALLAGDSAANLPLEENDVVHVYSYEDVRQRKQVSIDGLVKSPGEFDLVEGLTLEDLIVMAGGLLPQSFKIEAAIARSERDESSAGSDLPSLTMVTVPIDIKNFMKLSAEQRTPLKPEDRITIRSLPGWERAPVVLVRGQVRSPGNYSLTPGMERLSAVIKRAGGLTEEALPEGALIRRKLNIIKMEDNDDDKNYRDVTINLVAALANPGGPDDVVIKPKDKVVIPRNPGVVEVLGAVNRELTLQHKAGRTLGEYVALCGGYLDKADPAKIRVYGPNKAAIPLSAKAKSPMSLTIPPGSVIDVPFQHQDERLQTVEVKGAVTKPALIQYIEGAPLGYYLNLSGGFIADADIDAISVLAPDGGLLKKQGDRPFNPPIKGGSQIVIPTKSRVTAVDQ